MEINNINRKEYWPGDLVQAYEVLLNAFCDENDSNLLCQSNENDELLEKIKDWSPVCIVTGALFCLFEDYFESSKRRETERFTAYLWQEFFKVAINPKYTIDILIFARDMQYFKNSPKKVIFEGFFKAIFYYNSLFSLFFEKKQDLHNLENILYTLNVKESDITFLVDSCFEKKSFKGLLDFFETKPKDFSVNEVFLLEKVLLPFSVLEKNKKIVNELESFYAEFIEEKKLELEKFEIIDIFTSGEDAKAKVDVFNFLFLHQTFFLEIYKKKDFCLNLFLLFENYVNLKKEGNTRIANLTKKELFFHIDNFCIAKKSYISQEINVELTSLGKKWKSNKVLTYSKIVALIILFLGSTFFHPQPAQASRYVNKLNFQAKAAIEAPSINDRQVEKTEQIVPEKQTEKVTKKNQVIQKSLLKLNANLYKKGFQENSYQTNSNNQITVYNSLVNYNQVASYKRLVNEILETRHPRIEFDHFINRPFCNATGLSYNEGLTIARPPDLHQFLTGMDQIERPLSCGYGPERGTIETWLKDFFSTKIKNMEVFYKENSHKTDLVDFSQTVESTKKGMQLELARVRKIPTPPELILVVNDFLTFCQKATSEAKKFKEDIPRKIEGGNDIKKITKDFKKRVMKFSSLYAFHAFLSNKIPSNSLEYFMVQQEIKNFNYQLSQNVKYLIFSEAKITQNDQNYMLKPTFTPAGSWQDLEKIADDTFGFKNRTQGLKKPIFYRSTPNSFNKNLGVLDNSPENIGLSHYL